MKNKKILLTALVLGLPGAFALGHLSGRQSPNSDVEEQAKEPALSQRDGSSFGSSGLSGQGDLTTRLVSSRNRNSQASGLLEGPQLEAVAMDAFNNPSELKRSLAFAKLLEGLTPENALATMEAMRTHRAGGDEWELFRYAWGVVDPAAAMEHARTLEGRNQREAISDTLTGWASANPIEAIAWVDQMEDGEDKARFRGRLVDGLADNDITGATSYVLGLANQGDERAGRYLEDIAEEQLRSGSIQDAVAWTETLPPGEHMEDALDRVAGRYVNEDPEAAAAWAGRYASDEHGVQVIEEVGDEWAEHDPEAAVAWLNSLPEGRGQEEGLRSAIGEWARRNVTAAGEYLQNMPPSPARDAATSGYAQNVVREHPEAAVAWANSIGQDELRVQTLERTAREWVRRDPQTALVWLEGSGLPAEIQSRVTQSDRDRGRRSGR